MTFWKLVLVLRIVRTEVKSSKWASRERRFHFDNSWCGFLNLVHIILQLLFGTSLNRPLVWHRAGAKSGWPFREQNRFTNVGLDQAYYGRYDVLASGFR